MILSSNIIIYRHQTYIIILHYIFLNNETCFNLNVIIKLYINYTILIGVRVSVDCFSYRHKCYTPKVIAGHHATTAGCSLYLDPHFDFDPHFDSFLQGIVHPIILILAREQYAFD